MKKVLALILTAVLVLGSSVSTFAQSGEHQTVVAITASSTEINVGETVKLTAVTLKQGSTLDISSWNGAENRSMVFDSATGCYVSMAEFTPDKPGVYNIIYDIVMDAGKSDTYTKGTAFVTINVAGAATVIGAEIRNLVFTPVFGDDGSIAGYCASGNIYILWSDNTSTPYSTVFLFFGPQETAKDVEFYIDGTAYQYTLTVVRDNL